MPRTMIVADILLVALASSYPLMAQSMRRQAPAREYLEGVKKRPDLVVDYARVAKFKLASRKTTYRVGEMISIDLAIMNVSDAPVFFHKLGRPSLELRAQISNGASVSINTYYTVLEGTVPRSYQRVEPGHILSDTFQLLAGCDDSDLKAYFQETSKLQEEEHRGGERVFFKGLFERALFVNWGEACLAINSPGKYSIMAAQSNDSVLVSSNKRRVKTAVGTMHSSPLTLTITE